MINTYTYYDSQQNKLHGFVIAFFERTEKETGPFSTTFFEKEFYDNLVAKHKTILLKQFKAIYAITSNWSQKKRTDLCRLIKNSNEIKEICEGKIKPIKDIQIPSDIRDLIKKLFIELYEKVLKGKFFKAIYGTRLDHYHEFKKHAKNDFEFCPACNIVEMKNYEEDKADQYDHYLPKDVYPFSSVNFKNLAPICPDCNSFDVKSNKDILKYSGKVFYPFDENKDEIKIVVEIKKNDTDINKIEWVIKYDCISGKTDEIKAWKEIYKIESRHIKHISGNVFKWYGFYDSYMKNKEQISNNPDVKKRASSYLAVIRKTLEKKSLETLIDKNDLKARTESEKFSRYS